eukprot:GHVS01087935.1.p1 GENE.GHVS01087935.1~~GHVS01087935.1.p1  ORF type:complete len:2558 (-),score=448.23 GHVS01087935.1:647-8320(-)
MQSLANCCKTQAAVTRGTSKFPTFSSQAATFDPKMESVGGQTTPAAADKTKAVVACEEPEVAEDQDIVADGKNVCSNEERELSEGEVMEEPEEGGLTTTNRPQPPDRTATGLTPCDPLEDHMVSAKGGGDTTSTAEIMIDRQITTEAAEEDVKDEEEEEEEVDSSNSRGSSVEGGATGGGMGATTTIEADRSAILNSMFQLHSEGVYVDAFISFDDCNNDVAHSSTGGGGGRHRSGPYLSICSRLQLLSLPRDSKNTCDSNGKVSSFADKGEETPADMALSVTSAYSSCPLIFPLSCGSVEIKLPDSSTSDSKSQWYSTCGDEQLWQAHEGIVELANHAVSNSEMPKDEANKTWKSLAKARGYVKVVCNNQQLDENRRGGEPKVVGRHCLVIPLLQVHTPRVLSPLAADGVVPSLAGNQQKQKGALDAYLQTLFKNAVSFGDDNEDKVLAVRSSLLLYCSSDHEKLTGYLNMCRVTSYLRELLSKELLTQQSEHVATTKQTKTTTAAAGVTVGATTSTASGMSTTTAGTRGLSDSVQSDSMLHGNQLAVLSSEDEAYNSSGSNSDDEWTEVLGGGQRRGHQHHASSRRTRRVWSPNARRSVGWRMADGERVFSSYIELLCKMSTIAVSVKEGAGAAKEEESEGGGGPPLPPHSSRKFNFLRSLKWAASETLRDYERDGDGEVREMIAAHMHEQRGLRLRPKHSIGCDLFGETTGSCYQKCQTEGGGKKMGQTMSDSLGHWSVIIVESVLVESLRLWSMFGYSSSAMWRQLHHKPSDESGSEVAIKSPPAELSEERVVGETTKYACQKLEIQWAAPVEDKSTPQDDKTGGNMSSAWWTSTVDVQKRTVKPSGRWSDLGAVLIAAMSVKTARGIIDMPQDIAGSTAKWPASLLQDEGGGDAGITRAADRCLADQFNMQQHLRNSAGTSHFQGNRARAAMYRQGGPAGLAATAASPTAARTDVSASHPSTLSQMMGTVPPAPPPEAADTPTAAPRVSDMPDADSSQRVFTMILQLCNSKSGLSEFSSQESEVFQELLNWYASLKSTSTPTTPVASAASPVSLLPTPPPGPSRQSEQQHASSIAPPRQPAKPAAAVAVVRSSLPGNNSMPPESNGILGNPPGPPIVCSMAVGLSSSCQGKPSLRPGGSTTPSGRLGEFPPSFGTIPPPPLLAHGGGRPPGHHHSSATTTAAASHSDGTFFACASSGSLFPAATSRHGDGRFQTNIDGGRLTGFCPGQSSYPPHTLGHAAGGNNMCLPARGGKPQPLPPLLASPGCIPPRHPPPPIPSHRMPPFSNYPGHYDIAPPPTHINHSATAAPPGRAHSASVTTAVGWAPQAPAADKRAPPQPDVNASACHLIMNPPPPAGAPPTSSILLRGVGDAAPTTTTAVGGARVGAPVPPPPPYPRPSGRPLGIEIGGSMGPSAQVFTYISPGTPTVQPTAPPVAPAVVRQGPPPVSCESGPADASGHHAILSRPTTKGDEILQRLAEAIVSGGSATAPTPPSADPTLLEKCRDHNNTSPPPTSAFRLVDADTAAAICHTGKPGRLQQPSLPHGTAPLLPSHQLPTSEVHAGDVDRGRAVPHQPNSSTGEAHTKWSGLAGGTRADNTNGVVMEAELSGPLAAPVRELFQLYSSKADSLEQGMCQRVDDISSSHQSAQSDDRRSEPRGNGAAAASFIGGSTIGSHVLPPRAISSNIPKFIGGSSDGRDGVRPPVMPLLTGRSGQAQRSSIPLRPAVTAHTPHRESQQHAILETAVATGTSSSSDLASSAEIDRTEPSTIESFHVCLPISIKPFMQVPLSVQQGGESFYAFASPETGRVSSDMVGLRRILSCEYGVCQVLGSCLHGRVATISNVPSYLQPIVARLFNRIMGHHLHPQNEQGGGSRPIGCLSVKCTGIYQSFELPSYFRLPAPPTTDPNDGDGGQKEAPPVFPYRYVTKLCVASAAEWNGTYKAIFTGLSHLESQLKLLQAAIKQKVDGPVVSSQSCAGRGLRVSADDYIDVQFRYDVGKRHRPGSAAGGSRNAADDSVRVTVPIRSREWQNMTILLECPDPRAVQFSAIGEDKAGRGQSDGSSREAGEIGLVTLREEVSGTVQGADMGKCLEDEAARRSCVANHLYVEDVRIESISGTQLRDPRDSFGFLADPIRCRAIPKDVYNSMARVALPPLGKTAPRRGPSSPKHAKAHQCENGGPTSSTSRGITRGGGKMSGAHSNISAADKTAVVAASGTHGVSQAAAEDSVCKDTHCTMVQTSIAVGADDATDTMEITATQTAIDETPSKCRMTVTTVASRSTKVSTATWKGSDGSSTPQAAGSQVCRVSVTTAVTAPSDSAPAAKRTAKGVKNAKSSVPPSSQSTKNGQVVAPSYSVSDQGPMKQTLPTRGAGGGGRVGRGRTGTRTGKDSGPAKSTAIVGCTSSSGVSSASPKSATTAQGVRREYVPIVDGHTATPAGGTLVYAPKPTAAQSSSSGCDVGRHIVQDAKKPAGSAVIVADACAKVCGAKGVEDVLASGGGVTSSGDVKGTDALRQVENGGPPPANTVHVGGASEENSSTAERTKTEGNDDPKGKNG